MCIHYIGKSYTRTMEKKMEYTNCMYVCMYVRTYVRMYVCMHACMHVCMYVSINVYTCKGLSKLGVDFFGYPHDKDNNMLKSILGSRHFKWNAPYCMCV